ncbi:polysaccharide pyruvyl transferase family protein [Janibacter anophelis]|uniref:polysaccharide pyruvyl transferase family protein n=1 Tax=Janibacter anophelis TaxID=319054 RepID=UPI0012EE0421|nr:polysaccharide pyruvyl transferase family protein [Janibacter anophelis]
MPLSDERGRPMANNGDILMRSVLHDICRQQNVQLTGNPEHDFDFVAIPPNGALLDRFKAPDLITKELKRYTRKPLLIFPSSAQFLKQNPARMFDNRQAPTLWILREPYSMEHLERDWGNALRDVGVTLALDHDVVISGAEHVPRYIPNAQAGGIRGRSLLVGRLGVEARDIRNEMTTVDSYENRAGSNFKRMIVTGARSLPPRALRPLRRISTFQRVNRANRELLDAAPSDIRSKFTHLDRIWGTDLSDTSLVNFEQFCRRIGDANLVLTNRLHVAIPSALLGKETVLVDSGYHKLKGIFEHSLSDLDNVRFIARS